MSLDLDRPSAVNAAERYMALPRPLFTKLPASYRHVPLPLRTLALRVLAKVRPTTSSFPTWPIETSIDKAARTSEYAGRRAAVVITHDVDSPAELRFIDGIRAIERDFGIASAWGFVPEVSWPTEDLAHELVADGCEVYWHDIAHNGRLPYLGPDEIRAAFDRVLERTPWATGLINAFRSGQLLMSPTLMDVVAERFAIDLSIPDTERDGPYGGTAGCGTVVPFRVRGLLELPLTLPQDVFLRAVYGLSAEAVLSTWINKLAHIKNMGGVAILNVHPVWIDDAHLDLRSAFRGFLEHVASDQDLLVVTPSAVASAINA